MNESKRYYDIDWLRVLGMLTIFLFHNARFFDEMSWHAKNFELSFGMSVFVGILSQFIMPLFFVLSAFASYYALKKRTGTIFLGERVQRLLVPLMVGIFSHIIFQVYIENLTLGQFTGSFWAFIPHYFDGWYAFGGNFAWMGLHLWYLLILFIFSVLALPLFQAFNRATSFTVHLADIGAKSWGVYLLIIPLFLMELFVSYFPDSIGIRAFGGWSPLTYLLFFIGGYLLATDGRYRTVIQKVRGISLALSLVTVFLGYILVVELGVAESRPEFLVVRVANAWAWLLTFLGFASHYLNHNNAFLRYANEAVLPFYILHQTVIVALGYLIRDWQLAVFPKYLFLAATSFVIIMVLYEWGVKRIRVLRYLSGMKG